MHLTSQQIRIALLVHEAGSITKAAKSLYLAQSTVSGELATLERELGFSIFERTRKGVTLTKRGTEFIHRARRIEEEMTGIRQISKSGQTCRLRLTTFSSTRVENAFEKFCLRHRDAERIDISYQIARGSLEQRAEMVSEGWTDLALISTASPPDAPEKQYLQQHRLCYQAICCVSVVVTMAPTHPLSAGELAIERAGMYPRLESIRPAEHSTFYTAGAAATLRRSPSIQIQSRQVRLRLAAAGIGYFIGMPLKPGELAQYGLISRTVPGLHVNIGAVSEKHGLRSSEVNEFLELVQAEYRQDGYEA